MAVDLALTQARLTEAEDALHQLMMGKQEAEVRDQNGELIKFFPASAPRLRAYIMELKVQLGQSSVSGPMKFWMA